MSEVRDIIACTKGRIACRGMKTFSRAPEKFYTLPLVVLCLYEYLSTWQAPLSILAPSKDAGMSHHALLQGISSIQDSNLFLLHCISLCLLHWQDGSLPLVPPGKPCIPYTWGEFTIYKLYFNKVDFEKCK